MLVMSWIRNRRARGMRAAWAIAARELSLVHVVGRHPWLDRMEGELHGLRLTVAVSW
jgi:hypothetical protein